MAKTARGKKAVKFTEEDSIMQPPIVPETRTPSFLNKKVIIVGILAVALVAIFLTNKGLVLSAVVNGRPIFSWQLNNVLVSRYGQQTLEGMITEALITDEARKGSVQILPSEIDTKEKDIVKSLGTDVNLEDLLKYQGMSKAEFDSQIRLQLMIQKLLGKDIQITEQDIDNYIATNRATLVATEPAQLREETRQVILDQKIGEKVQPWFNELKQKASIIRYL